MANNNILRQTFTKDIEGEVQIKMVIEGSVDIATINDYLPNNGTKYDRRIGFIDSGSEAKVITSDALIMCMFTCELGNDNSKTGFKEGKWNVLVTMPFIA